MTVPTRRPRAAQGQGDRLRGELVEAARRILVSEASHEAVTLRRVARDLGVSAPSIYLHFEDRDALVEAALIAQFARFRDSVATAGRQGSTAFENLRSGIGAYCQFAVDEPGGYAVLFARPMPTASGGPIGLDSFQVLVLGVAGCMAEGSLPPGDAFGVARAIWVALHGMVSLRTVMRSFPWNPLDEALDELLATLRR